MSITVKAEALAVGGLQHCVKSNCCCPSISEEPCWNNPSSIILHCETLFTSHKHSQQLPIFLGVDIQVNSLWHDAVLLGFFQFLWALHDLTAKLPNIVMKGWFGFESRLALQQSTSNSSVLSKYLRLKCGAICLTAKAEPKLGHTTNKQQINTTEWLKKEKTIKVLFNNDHLKARQY